MNRQGINKTGGILVEGGVSETTKMGFRDGKEQGFWYSWSCKQPLSTPHRSTGAKYNMTSAQ